MAEIKDEIKELALAGVTKEELLELIEEVFTKKEGQDND